MNLRVEWRGALLHIQSTEKGLRPNVIRLVDTFMKTVDEMQEVWPPVQVRTTIDEF